MDRAITYIWNFSHWLIDVPAVARRVGVARRTLDRRFAAVRGQTVLQEINSCRLTRAARLLRETEMPVKQIVQRAGFHTDEQFRIAFRKAYGTSPQSFRTRDRQEPEHSHR